MKKENKQAAVPALRFPEFWEAEEWEEKPLGEIAKSESSMLAQNKLQLLKNGYPVYGASGLIGFIKSYAQDEDYIAIVKDGSGVGKLFFYNKKSSVLGTLTSLKSRNLKKYDLKWLYYLLQTIDFSTYVKGSGIPHIYFSDYSNQTFTVPKLPEQQKIATFLTTLDMLISAESEKLRALQAHKKGLMQQLFPGEGETVPRVRFGEFEGEWEEKKLGELVDIKSGGSPSNYPLAKAGKYPFLKVEDLNNCEKYQKTSREYSNVAENAIPSKSIIFAKRGAAIELNKVRINLSEVLMDSNLMAITPNKNIHSEFLYYLVVRIGLHKIADTSTIPQINNKHIIPHGVVIPTKLEQQKIAACLSSFDELIAAQSEKLEALKAYKKGLMQRLFPNPKTDEI